MKIKFSVLVIFSMFLGISAYSQHQLYFETFNNATNTFTINDNQIGTNKGNNKWVIDTNYFGGGINHPRTINESQTYSGSIQGAPYSQYLHIYDSASGYFNDNYNPTDSSTRFAHMTTGICTKALTGVTFNFYYLCQGSPTAYGIVYYSVNGGTWTSTGDTLDKKYKWQFASITNSAYRNVEDLRFGFLWHNNKAAAGRDTSALGIDDVSLFGTYDSVAHPITCTFNTYGFDSCLGGNDYVFFSSTLNDSTCNSDWDCYMEPSVYGWYQPVGISYFNDLTQYWYLIPPNSFNTPGHCYKFKLVRNTYPYLTFTDSVCFPFDSCPGTITTIPSPALQSSVSGDTACAGSVVDIGFYSTGLYQTYNIYYAQLIDSTGYHTAKIDTIGTLASNVAWGGPPGDVVSTLPKNVPAGCNYYVRIVSSTPNRVPSMWGPFCIQHCDITTDSLLDAKTGKICMKSCAKEPNGYYDTVKFNLHSYDPFIHYHNGNKFEVQLVSVNLIFDSFTILDTMGAVADTISGKMIFHVQCADSLAMHGVTAGSYYIRVIADSSFYPDSALGTLIPVSIGIPADSMYLTLSVVPNSPPPYCAGITTLTFDANPNNSPKSTYNWWETDKTHGTVSEYPWNSFYFAPIVVADTFQITCQENSFGCLGNKFTLPDTIVVEGKPSIVKTGPTTVCLGDTGTFSIPFDGATNYKWEISKPAHADTATNVLKIRFDTTGSVRVSVVAFDYCFTDSAVWTVTVVTKPAPLISTNPNTATFCAGNPVNITVTAVGVTGYLWDNGYTTSTIGVTPSADTSYWVKASNKGCFVYDTVKLKVIPKPVVTVLPCVGDSVSMHASGATTYTWLPSAGLTIHDSIAKGIVSTIQTFTVVGTTNGCTDTVDVPINPTIRTDNIIIAQSINSGQNVQLFVNGGTSWLWSPASTLNNDTISNPIATPPITTVYTVTIKNPNGCLVVDTVTVDVTSQCDIWVPTGFAPSDPSNHNTILFARCQCPVSDFDFKVFDRWGNKVFESFNISDGWDGTSNGKALNPGTFVYYISGQTNDGKSVTKKGNVTLVR